jgi:hypothetical protein
MTPAIALSRTHASVRVVPDRGGATVEPAPVRVRLTQ